jgi:hypothetical protein
MGRIKSRNQDGVIKMCDYSLMHLQSRPAVVGDRLVVKNFVNSRTVGLGDPREPEVAVCLLPGTEVAFDAPVLVHECVTGIPIEQIRDTGHKVARFRQINTDTLMVHHDAVEFPDGSIALVTLLSIGQVAIVLQLPAAPKTVEEAQEQKRLEVVA